MSASDSESMSGSEQGSEEVSGNSDESMEEVEGSESEEEEEEIVELKVLPQRGTRGNRMTTLIAEEDSADEEFWQQDFFAEEGKDEEYEKSSEGEDEADTDFSESESESDEEAQEQTESVRTSRHKPLKPPGSKKAIATRVKQPVSEEIKALQAELKAERLAQQAPLGEAPTLRQSTRIRVEEAQQVRQRAEKVKPKRVRPQLEQRPLTQDELLAEAARTELDNLRDLEHMVALEEATKKKAMYKRSKYSGPMIRFHSKRVDEVALTMVEVVNMLPPPHMLPMKAPKPPAKLRCAITGKPACYRDPASGYGYADLEAYKELQQRLQNQRRGIMTGKRTKRQPSRASSLPHTAQPASTEADAVHHTLSGAMQDVVTGSGDQLPASTSPAESATAAANQGAAQASQVAPGNAPADAAAAPSSSGQESANNPASASLTQLRPGNTAATQVASGLPMASTLTQGDTPVSGAATGAASHDSASTPMPASAQLPSHVRPATAEGVTATAASEGTAEPAVPSGTRVSQGSSRQPVSAGAPAQLDIPTGRHQATDIALPDVASNAQIAPKVSNIAVVQSDPEPMDI